MLFADAIEHEGALWLVPTWLEALDEGWRTPARIIPLATIRHQRVSERSHQIVVNVGLPKALFGDPIPPELARQFHVRERPGIQFPILS